MRLSLNLDVLGTLAMVAGIAFYGVAWSAPLLPHPVLLKMLIGGWLLFFLLYAWVGVTDWMDKLKGRQRAHHFGWDRAKYLPVVSLLLTVVIEGWLILAGKVAYNFFAWTQNPSTDQAMAMALAVPVAWGAGIAMYILRLKLRTVYGIAEIGVSAVVAIGQVQSSSGSFNAAAFLTAAVYLVVRGLDNIHQGLNSPESDAFARWILARSQTQQGQLPHEASKTKDRSPEQ